MSGIYLRDCFIENIGPIQSMDISFEIDNDGNPKPVILVGKNGTGKTMLLAYVLDALAEVAKNQFTDIVSGQQPGHIPFIKSTSTGDTRSLSGTGLCLLEFSGEPGFCYIEKIGHVDPNQYAKKLGQRFKAVQSWPPDQPAHKVACGEKAEEIKAFFQRGSICYFPASRHERPHWLNAEAVADQSLFTANNFRVERQLGKPLVVERTFDKNLPWLMDILFDSLVDMEIQTSQGSGIGNTSWLDATGGSNLQLIPAEASVSSSPPGYTLWLRSDVRLHDKQLLQVSRDNIETLLRAVLENDGAKLVINYRHTAIGRIAIRLGNGVLIPSLAHLSAGQAVLFNLFCTIIRYADDADLNKSLRLQDIEGIVIIDEIDAHLHTDMQYRVLPQLIKLFPKVQFLITSHAPLFLLGMEREFGASRLQILEMPAGRSIGTEDLEEFKKSFEYYQCTLTFENELKSRIKIATKPLVFVEGKTDVAYLRIALELLEPDMLARFEIEEIGKTDGDGTKGGGYKGLDDARKFLENHSKTFPRPVLLLYDGDTKKKPENIGQLVIRAIPINMSNTKVTKGIENLFQPELFTDNFYRRKNNPTGYGGDNVISEFQKEAFCEHICRTRRNAKDFVYFEALLIPILKQFLTDYAASG